MESKIEPNLPEQKANEKPNSTMEKKTEVAGATKVTAAGASKAAPTVRRIIQRRKSIVVEEPKVPNLKIPMKPRKRKRIKIIAQSLETIYEETNMDEPTEFIGGNKTIRRIMFSSAARQSKEKIEMRRERIKRLFGNKFKERKEIPMKTFLEKIDNIEDSLPIRSLEHSVV